MVGRGREQERNAIGFPGRTSVSLALDLRENIDSMEDVYVQLFIYM